MWQWGHRLQHKNNEGLRMDYDLLKYVAKFQFMAAFSAKLAQHLVNNFTIWVFLICNCFKAAGVVVAIFHNKFSWPGRNLQFYARRNILWHFNIYLGM